MDELGAVIRDARKRMGLSQRGLEKLVGVSNAHLSQLETGKIEHPSLALLYAIAEALDLDYTTLLKLSGQVEVGTKGRPVPGVAFRGSEDLTPDEADEVLRFIELLKRRQQ